MRATGAWFSHGSRGSLKIHTRNARHGDRGSSNGREEEDDAAAKVVDEEIGLKVMVFFTFNYPKTPGYGPQRGRIRRSDNGGPLPRKIGAVITPPTTWVNEESN
jgi:hypothetical protein